MRRLLFSLSAALVVLGLAASPPASAQQTINLFVGGFVPHGRDARPGGDVLVKHLGCRECLDFRIGDFNGATVGGEWLVGLGDLFEGGLGIGLYTRGVPTVYANFTDADRNEIEQDLKLRIVPFSATIRFLPLGHHGLEPYIGAGVGVLAWRYSEAGDFVNFADPRRIVSPEVHVGSGSETSPVILGGVRVLFGPIGVGGEVRYQSAEGTLPTNQKFVAPTIDLGGFNYLLTVNIRF